MEVYKNNLARTIRLSEKGQLILDKSAEPDEILFAYMGLTKVLMRALEKFAGYNTREATHCVKAIMKDGIRNHKKEKKNAHK